MATRHLVIHTVDLPLPEVVLTHVVDIDFSVALIIAQAQFFRNLHRSNSEEYSPTEPL